MKYVKDCIMLKVSKTSIGNVNPNCSTLTNAEKCRKYREKKKSKDDEYAKKERIRQQENRKRRTTKQIENDRIKSKIRMRRLRERRKKEKEPEMELKLNVSNLSNSNKEQRKKWRKAKQKYRKFLFDRNKDDIYEGKNLEECNSGDNGKQLNEKFGKGRSFYENVSPADTSHYKNRSLRFEGDVNQNQGSGTKFDDTEKAYGSTSSESGSYVIGTDKGSASEDEDVKLILQDKIPSINNLYSISDLLEVKAFKLVVDYVNSRVPLNELVSNPTFSPNLRIDNVSSKIIPDITNFESKNQDLYPVHITGDGNCLPRTGSVLAFGSEDRHEEIRKRIVVEMIKNRDQYLSLYHIATEEDRQRLLNSFTMYSSRYTKVGKITDEVVRNVFDQEIMHIMQPNSHMGIWQICALATILNAPIASVYPERGSPEVQKDLHRIIRPLPIAENPACRMHYIMWTNTQNISTEKHWTPNHFVPLIPKENIRNSKHSDCSLSNKMSTHDENTSNSDNNALLEDTSFPNIEDRNFCSFDDLYCPTESSRKITRTVTECSTVYAPPCSSIPFYTNQPFFSSQLQQRGPIIQGHQELDYNTKNSVPQVPRVGSLHFTTNVTPSFLNQPEIVSRQQPNNSFLYIPFTNQTAGELPGLKTNKILPAQVTSQEERYWQNLPHVEGIKMNDQRYSYGPQDETRDHYQLNEFPKQTRCLQTGNLPIPRQVLIPAITEDRMKYSRNNRNETCTASLVSSFSLKRNLPAGARIHRCCIIPGRRLLLTDFICNCIYICGIDGTYDNSINVDYDPLFVTLYDKNKALVSACSKGIAVINLTSLKTDRMIKLKGLCCGITSIDDKICVETGLKTLTMIDINGTVLKEINTSFYHREICINKAGDIYYTTFGNNSVYFVTSEGEERQIYSSPDLRYAIGLITDNNGDVYVGGRKSNNIHKISSDGKRHRIILTKNDGIKSPRELSYNKETNELMVLCGGAFSNGQSINVYKVK